MRYNPETLLLDKFIRNPGRLNPSVRSKKARKTSERDLAAHDVHELTFNGPLVNGESGLGRSIRLDFCCRKVLCMFPGIEQIAWP